MIPINNHSLIIESKNRLHRQCEAYDDYRLKYPTYHSLESYFLRRKNEKIKNLSDEKQQISRLFIYRIKQLQSNTIYH